LAYVYGFHHLLVLSLDRMRCFFLLACLVGASALTMNAEVEKPKKKAHKVVEKIPEERLNLPKFVWLDQKAKYDQAGFSWANYRWNLDSPGLRNHPSKVVFQPSKNQSDVKFAIICCLDKDTEAQFLKLPKRSPERPYLVKILGASDSIRKVFDKREDFLAVNYDLRDGMDKQAAPLRGITIAPHNYFNGKRMKEEDNRKFFVTFQGRKTSKLRHVLHDAFNKHPQFKLMKNISVETVMDRMWNVKQQTGDAKFNQKMNSTYVLLPKGDDRWSLRFSETIGAGAIPVILADGLTLPYEHTIDWSKAAIRLPNSMAENAEDIMKHLPKDKETILKMRKAVYDINRNFFTNPQVRADALLREADAVVKLGGKYSPLWKPEEAEPWLEENRAGATQETKTVAQKNALNFKVHTAPSYVGTNEQSTTVA